MSTTMMMILVPSQPVPQVLVVITDDAVLVLVTCRVSITVWVVAPQLLWEECGRDSPHVLQQGGAEAVPGQEEEEEVLSGLVTMMLIT